MVLHACRCPLRKLPTLLATMQRGAIGITAMPDIPIRIAIAGYGKIAADSHIPAIRANPDFDLVAVVSARGAGPDGVPVFVDMDALLASELAVDAISHCNTPTARRETAIAALRAGKHALLEKPPAATATDWTAIAAEHQPGTTLMTGWHSQANAAVEAARAWLADKSIANVELEWREDVGKWHPGQDWIWEEGGFGVFDPGINGLSIATRVFPFALEFQAARLEIPANKAMPIAANLTLRAKEWDGQMDARFDWRETTGECWRISVNTNAGTLTLEDGGTRLLINDVEQLVHGNDEYPTLYRQFAKLIRTGASQVDVAPMELVSAALERGERRPVAAYN
jgi:predicted dehydrogenase